MVTCSRWPRWSGSYLKDDQSPDKKDLTQTETKAHRCLDLYHKTSFTSFLSICQRLKIPSRDVACGVNMLIQL